MSARTRRSAAISLTTAITAAGALLLTGCGAKTPAASSAHQAAPSSSASASSAPSSTPSSAPSSAPAPGKVLSSTSGGGLTISNGTRYVVVDGATRDFGTVVRDLSWSPDGSKAAFIDGSGNLDVANPDGSGRVVVAVAGSGQNWSHPTWQVAKAAPSDKVAAKDNIVFAQAGRLPSALMTVSATADHGTPTPLPLGHYSGNGVTNNPTTFNAWADAAGGHGSAVYENTGNGGIYIRDDYIRQQGGRIATGSEPALFGDDSTEAVVFVRSVNGHDHIFEQSLQTPKAQAHDLTPNLTTDATAPAWSADGKTVAFRTPTGVDTVRVDGSAAPVQVSTSTGLPAYRG
ncbi:TolB-like translocation protein [Streptacidiphilus sp. PAMC 29251]